MLSSILDLLNVPDGLNAKELERYLRERGEGICNRGARPQLRTRDERTHDPTLTRHFNGSGPSK